MISPLKVDQHITDLSSVIPTLQSHLGLVEAASREEVSAGLENYRYQHLSQIAPESRLLGKQGLKLKVNYWLDKFNDKCTISYYNYSLLLPI